MMRTALAATVLCLAAVACGGGDPDPVATSAPPTTVPTTTIPTSAAPSPLDKATYVTQVNAICKEVVDGADKIAEPKTAQDYLDATTTIADLIDDAQLELEELVPPAEDQAAIEENFLGPIEEQSKVLNDAIPDLAAAAQANDTAAAERAFGEAFVQFNAISEESDKWLIDYGLTECSSEA